MAQFISTDDANPVQCFRLCGRRGQSDGDCGIAGGTIVDASYGRRVAEIEDALAFRSYRWQRRLCRGRCDDPLPCQ
jgi:hypothetical protein